MDVANDACTVNSDTETVFDNYSLPCSALLHFAGVACCYLLARKVLPSGLKLWTSGASKSGREAAGAGLTRPIGCMSAPAKHVVNTAVPAFSQLRTQMNAGNEIND